MIFLPQTSKNSNCMRVEHFTLIIQLAIFIFCILVSETNADVSVDAFAPVQDAGETNTNLIQIKTYPNQQPECKCENGTCAAVGNISTCVCDPGFSKITSTTCKACKCGSGFSCTFDVGFFSTAKKCVCTEGFLEINGVCKECNCGKNGDCEINNKEAKICRCNSGYVEVNGHCDDCGCGKNTTCQMIDDIKFCACPSGFIDNRGVCVDVDECELPGVCPSHTRCINTPGSFECTCEEGYEPKSKSSNAKIEGCKDINECLDNKTCPFSATLCINLPGSYRCDCKEGYQPINFQGDSRYTRCRENNASWHNANIALIVVLVASLVALLGVTFIRRRRTYLMSRNVNAYETL